MRVFLIIFYALFISLTSQGQLNISVSAYNLIC